MKRIVTVLLTLILALPAAAALTIALMPGWSWLERTTGLESVGHGGPASWCYASVYVLLVGLACFGWCWRRAVAQERSKQSRR